LQNGLGDETCGLHWKYTRLPFFFFEMLGGKKIALYLAHWLYAWLGEKKLGCLSTFWNFKTDSLKAGCFVYLLAHMVGIDALYVLDYRQSKTYNASIFSFQQS
jgi:hypothetical protein